MKVTYVVPRYGLEVIGGAELGVRMLAEQLVLAGVEVEVCTTCAVDSDTWADSYPPGAEQVNGVLVRRFRSTSGRDPRFDELSARVLPDAAGASEIVEREWIERQGPVCPAALDAAGSSRAQVVIFSPYLFWPSVTGILRFGRRALLHPATHEEAPIHLPIFRRVFGSVGALAFYTEAEQRLTEQLFPAVSALPQTVIGLGVVEGAGLPAGARAAIRVGERPYLLCLGRVDAGKGTVVLRQFFAAYKQRHPGPLALVYVGPVVDPLPPHPDVIVTGAVDESVKWGALRGASVVVSPSTSESFSLALLEGWTAGRPALVNAACHATAGHVRASGGGLCFDSYAAFEVSLERLLADAALRSAMGSAGRDYVARRYSWPRLAERYCSFLTGLRVEGANVGVDHHGDQLGE